MTNDLENEVNEKKDKKLQYHHGIELTTYSITPERLTQWAMWPADDSGVKLQYKVAQTRPVNITRMRDRSYKRDWSVWYTARLPIAASVE